MALPRVHRLSDKPRPTEVAQASLQYNDDDLSVDAFVDEVRRHFGNKPTNALQINLSHLVNGLSDFFPALPDEARSVIFEVPYFKNLPDLVESYLDRMFQSRGCNYTRKWRTDAKGTRKSQIKLASNSVETLECQWSIDKIGLAGTVVRYEFHREAYVPLHAIGSNVILRGASRYWKNLDQLKGFLEGAFLRSGLPESSKADFEHGVQSVINRLAYGPNGIDSQSLSVPDSQPPRYEGKKKSGDIIAFLREAYAPGSGGEPLTLQYLREHDPKAYTALYNHQRKEPLPNDLHLPRQTAVSDRLLARYGVDLDTADGIEEARRLAGIIYGRLKFEPKS